MYEIIKESEKSKILLCYDNSSKRMTVVKRLSGNIDIYLRLRSLKHKYLPEIYDVRFENGETVVTEEYIPGNTVGSIKANEKQILRWFFELCDVLSFLHGKGIIHRDIKPSNIIIGADGHIRLIDFDAAREEKENLDCDTRILGTRGYAPPEQYGFAQTDERADIYSMGMTFKQLLGEKSKKRRWKRILNKCTELEVGRRYRRAHRVKSALLCDRLFCRVIWPIITFFTVLFTSFIIYVFADKDVKRALDVVFMPGRETIFERVDMENVKLSNASLDEFLGDEMDVYEYISETRSDITFISTGYCNKDGYLLFGGFASVFYIKTGYRRYSRFVGLYYIDENIDLHWISPEKCAEFAPAVLALFELDVFKN